jgi:hypothetical protein
VKDLRAVGKERLTSGSEIESTGIEFDEVSDECGGRLPRAPSQTVHFYRELIIRKVRWKWILHNPV